MIRWGFIGCGSVTEKKSGPAFNKVDGSEIVAVMRRDKEKAMEDFKAGKYQACMAKMPESNEDQNADIPTATAQ